MCKVNNRYYNLLKISNKDARVTLVTSLWYRSLSVRTNPLVAQLSWLLTGNKYVPAMGSEGCNVAVRHHTKNEILH